VQWEEESTYAGNRPLTRATYSLRTVPVMNSSVSARALSGDRGMIIRPEVSLSSRFAAKILVRFVT